MDFLQKKKNIYPRHGDISMLTFSWRGRRQTPHETQNVRCVILSLWQRFVQWNLWTGIELCSARWEPSMAMGGKGKEKEEAERLLWR